MSVNKRWIVVMIVGFAVALFFGLDLQQYFKLDMIQAQQAELQAWRAARPIGSVLAFFAAYVACTALSLPGATILTLAAGAMFGLVWGTVISSFASSVGATLAFWASRIVLRDWVQARFAARLAAINDGVARDGGFYLLTLRLVPVMPFFVINLALGVTGLRTWTFYWVSQVGMLAATMIYVNAGTQLARVHSLHDIATPGAKTVIAQRDYLYAQYTSRLMRFVDDVEFWYDPLHQVIQVRSASRLGKGDMGVNRQRIESVRAALASAP